jgi:hypothetical protein
VRERKILKRAWTRFLLSANVLLRWAASRKDAVGACDQSLSRSPSTSNGERLELLCYAFRWAARDVLQLMNLLCTAKRVASRAE